LVFDEEEVGIFMLASPHISQQRRLHARHGRRVTSYGIVRQVILEGGYRIRLRSETNIPTLQWQCLVVNGHLWFRIIPPVLRALHAMDNWTARVAKFFKPPTEKEVLIPVVSIITDEGHFYLDNPAIMRQPCASFISREPVQLADVEPLNVERSKSNAREEAR
jgi:hypothetical protein